MSLCFLKAVSQRLIPAGERFGLPMHTRDDGKRFVVHADEKLTAFLELESAIRGEPRRAQALTSSAGAW